MNLDRPAPQVRPLVVAAAMIAALALQTTVLNSVTIGGVKPDLVLVLAMCAGLLSGPGMGAMYGAAAGVLEGYAQGSHLGSLGVSRALAAFLAGTVETRLLRNNLVVPAATVFLGSAAAHAIFFVMAPAFPIARPLRIAAMESLLNMLIAPVCYAALARWGRGRRR